MTTAQIFDALFDYGHCKCLAKELDAFMLTHHSVDSHGVMAIVKNATVVKHIVKYKKISPKILTVWVEEIPKN